MKQVFIMRKTVYWFTEKNQKACELQLYNWIMNIIFMNRYWKELRPVTILKKILYLRCFLASFSEFLHNDGFWDFLRIILQIFEWLLLDFLLLNRLFVNVIKIINLKNLKLYPAKLTRISFITKSRFILSDYFAIRDANYAWFEFDVGCILSSVCLISFTRNFLVPLEWTF